MKYSVTRVLVFVLLLCSFLMTVPGVAADKEVLATLHNHYRYAMEEDLEGYMSLQDPYFLETLEMDMAEYVRALFEVTDVRSYVIQDPDVILNEGALVFYRLSGEFVISETGEPVEIENDMVAFLWKYDHVWKVRWTMTRSLYEQKIFFGLLSDAAVDQLLDDVDEKTVEEEMVELGEAIEIEDEEGTIAKGFSFTGILYPLLFFVVLAVLVLLAWKHGPKLLASVQDKRKEKSEKQDMKRIADSLKKHSKHVAHHTKKVAEKISPHIKKEASAVSKDLKEKNIGSTRLFLLFWVIIALIVLAVTRTFSALYGVAFAALISYFLWQYTVNSEWAGKIDRIRKERVRKGSDEEQDFYQEILFAYIVLDDGKTKKIRAMPEWKKGDRIVKEKGKLAPEKQ
jgi:hypothetical protein